MGREMAADRADLVIVGAGTIGGWASYFARTSGADRVIVVERGRVGEGASSRAAGMVRAQGGTPTTVALDAGVSSSTGGNSRCWARTRAFVSSAT